MILGKRKTCMTQSAERVPPYEGNEPYIFISYSHRDMNQVMPIVKALIDYGYRVWYDEGIDPGSEWPESIANHLAGSTVFMYFISKNSLASSNCKHEINFALNRKIGFLSVALEPAEMPLGMELQISTYMSLVKYKYPSEEAFMSKLLELEILKPCLKEKEIEDVHIEPVPGTKEVKETVQEQKETPVIAETVSKTNESKKNRQRKIKEKKTKTPADKKSPLKYILAGVLAAAVLFVIVLTKSSSSPPAATVKIGENEYKDNSYVHIQGETITAADMDKILSLEKCISLDLTDCRFESGVSGRLGDYSRIVTLKMTGCTGIESLSFVGKLEKLSQFYADSCGITDGMIAGVSFPQTCKTVSLNDNSLTVLPDLSGCESLKELYLNSNSIESIDALSANPKLEKLYLSGNKISDISVLEPMIYLKEINIASNAISSLEPLHNCTVLSRVDVSDNSEIADLSVIAANSSTLTELWACGLPNADFSILSDCVNLKTLNINSSAVSDIGFMRKMTSLEILNAADNQITDLSPLSNLTNLYTFNLADNQLTSLTGLPQTPAKDDIFVLLNGNQLTELTGLPKAKEISLLSIYDNPWESAPQMKDLKGFYLLMDYTPAFNKEDLTVYTRIYVLSVDLSEQLALENALGTRLHYSTAEEILPEAANYFNSAHIVLP